MQAEAQLRVARVALLADDFPAADGAAGQAAASFRRQQRTGWAARAMVVRAEARLQTGSVTDEDLRQVRRAAMTLERLALTTEAVEGHLVAGRAGVALERTSVGGVQLRPCARARARVVDADPAPGTHGCGGGGQHA